MLANFLHSLFYEPVSITGIGRLTMLLPLAMSVSIVYKSIHCERVGEIPIASLTLCGMIVAFMMMIWLACLIFIHWLV